MDTFTGCMLGLLLATGIIWFKDLFDRARDSRHARSSLLESMEENKRLGPWIVARADTDCPIFYLTEERLAGYRETYVRRGEEAELEKMMKSGNVVVIDGVGTDIAGKAILPMAHGKVIAIPTLEEWGHPKVRDIW